MKMFFALTQAEVKELLLDYVRQRFNLPDSAKVSDYRDGYSGITITFEEPEKPAEGGDA